MRKMTKTMLTKTAGIYTDERSASTVSVTMRFSSDKIGETLSLEAMGRQITVPFEAVLKLAEETRKASKR